MRKIRLKNSTHYTLVLLSAIALYTYLFWRALIFFPVMWDWPIIDIRTSSSGRREQSILTMLSLLSGILGGLSMTEKIRRGFRESGWQLLVCPVAASILMLLEMRSLELLDYAPQNSALFHLALLVLWLFSAYIYLKLSTFFASTRGSRRKAD